MDLPALLSFKPCFKYVAKHSKHCKTRLSDTFEAKINTTEEDGVNSIS